MNAHREDRPSGSPNGPDDDAPVLPDIAQEDRDEAWGDERDGGRRDDEWYRRQRPPHHE